MKQQSIRATISNQRYVGAGCIELIANIVSGPQSFVDRRVHVSLTQKDVNALEALIAEVKEQRREEQKKVARINLGNSPLNEE